MWFELWETETANLIQEFDSESEAIAFVRDAAQRHGRDYVMTWELAQVQDGSDSRAILAGEKLAARALKGAAA